MATRVMKVYDLYWSPTGAKIDTVTASTKKAAIRKAPKPYSRYKGEIYAEDRGTASNPGKQSMRDFKRLLKGGRKGAAKMTASAWREIKGILGSDAGPGVRKKSRSNPGVKTISLKNFTGKVRINPGVKAGAVQIAGVGKRGKR